MQTKMDNQGWQPHKYFTEIRNVKIECGWNFSVAMDENGKCYGWRTNSVDQCGVNNNLTMI